MTNALPSSCTDTSLNHSVTVFAFRGHVGNASALSIMATVPFSCRARPPLPRSLDPKLSPISHAVHDDRITSHPVGASASNHDPSCSRASGSEEWDHPSERAYFSHNKARSPLARIRRAGHDRSAER